MPDFVLDKRKRGFFNEAVGTWMGAEDGALVERLLLDPDPAYAAVVDPGTVAPRGHRMARGPRRALEPAARRS